MSAPENSKPPKKANVALKYAGIAFELFILLFIGAFIGGKLDQKLQLEESYMTILMLLLAFFLFFYRLVKQLSADSD